MYIKKLPHAKTTRQREVQKQKIKNRKKRN